VGARSPEYHQVASQFIEQQQVGLNMAVTHSAPRVLQGMIALVRLEGCAGVQSVQHLSLGRLEPGRKDSLPIVALELGSVDEFPGHRLRSFKRPSTELNRGDRETSSCKARRVTLFGVQVSKIYR